MCIINCEFCVPLCDVLQCISMYVFVLDLNKFDPERFHPPGLDFRGKLIGIEDVPDARGDKMCQVVSDCDSVKHALLHEMVLLTKHTVTKPLLC